MTPLRSRKSLAQSPFRLSLLLIPLALAWFAVAPTVQAQLIPPPDGGYPNANTAEGEDALFSCDTSTGFAFGNTAVGYQACYNLVDNMGNTGIGYAARYNNEGDGNTAIGKGTLYGNTTGGANTGVGAYALGVNTTGNWDEFRVDRHCRHQ